MLHAKMETMGRSWRRGIEHRRSLWHDKCYFAKQMMASRKEADLGRLRGQPLADAGVEHDNGSSSNERDHDLAADHGWADQLLHSVLQVMKKIIILALSVLGLSASAGNYSLPAGRSTQWYPAGLDVVGGIPTSFTATNTISGVHPNGLVDDSGTINNAIASAASNTVLYLPAGKYLISSADIRMANGVVLRGAKAQGQAPFLPTADATATTLVMANGHRVYFSGGDKSSSFSPASPNGTSINVGYTAGSTNLTLSSGSGYAAGDLIAIYQNKDGNWIDDRGYSWLGGDYGNPESHVWQQYSTITSVNGNVITVEPPLYQVTPSPTGQCVRKQTGTISRAGLENLRVQGDGQNSQGLVLFTFCKYSWMRGVETYNAGANSGGSPHVWTMFCYACEFRHNYCHHGAGNASGENYGLEFYHWNSRHKIEDNIIRDTRHAIAFEGGGSGCVMLYNYTDDNWEEGSTDANSFLSIDQAGNHGAHPHMNLWEGNNAANIFFDYTQGSSSHNTVFRNTYRGYRTAYPLSNPWLQTLCAVYAHNWYENFIGNILGNPSMAGRGGVVINNNGSGTVPSIFQFGMVSSGGGYNDAKAYETAILQGNYDYVSQSIYTNSDPSNTILPVSLYYTNGLAPAYFGSLRFPPYDNTRVSAPQINRTNIPAGYRYVYGVDPPVGTPGGQAPVVVASATPTSGPAPLTVTFSSAGSYDPEGVVLTYNWSFGDGSVSTVANPSHSYLINGTFQAQLSVSDGVNTTPSSSLTITVTASNPLPIIRLTSPTNDASFADPATINLTASVTANGHTITKVQFYNVAVLLGEDTATPYNLSWSNVAAGSYNVTARAVYDSSATIDSAAVRITVADRPPPPVALHVVR
jgi:PKD repeat protein